MMVDEVDEQPTTILKGATYTYSRQVWIGDDPIAAPWQARAQIRDKIGGNVLVTPTCTVSNGVVSFTLDAQDTEGYGWSTGILGVEVFDDSSPEVVYRIVQAPITTSDEVVTS